MPRHRVTTKGSNVADHIESFQQLEERYKVPSYILSNLRESGYKRPTGIQSHGIPILMEARVLFSLLVTHAEAGNQSRDVAAISPTGTGKTLSYLLPVMSLLGTPVSRTKADLGSGVRAIILAPTRELAHQIHNECLKLAQGRKWRIVLFSKATASTLADKSVSDKVGMSVP